MGKQRLALRQVPVFVASITICQSCASCPTPIENHRTNFVASRGSFQPLGFQSRDMGLFKDDDGSAYLLSEDVSVLIGCVFAVHYSR